MKKQFKSTASSGRAASGSAAFSFGGFGSSSTFDANGSSLSYVYEPPDLTTFSDANLVVSFKNLMKKDATTKSKALEDIHTYLKTSGTEIEEALISAYVKLYPRLSIDSNRRVRQLAHAVLGLVASGAGKRIGPYMQQTAGPWFCGQADADRSVARAAVESLHQAFQSKEKVQNFPKLLQRPIAEYCRNAILNETPQTLSDERTTSKEDSNATYHRVLSASLSSLSSLVADLPLEEVQKQVNIYCEILAEKRVWEISVTDDIGSRRALFRFLSACLALEALSQALDLSMIGNVLINKALITDQTSTASDLASALKRLTQHSTSIWTSEYKGKKPPIQRLRHFIKRGSQHSSASFWPTVSQLFALLPQDVLPKDETDAGDLMKDLLSGVTQRDDRLQVVEGWNAYLDIANTVLLAMTENDSRTFSQTWLMPIILQFLNPAPTLSQWAIPANSTETILAKALQGRGIPEIVTKEWPSLTTALIDVIKASQPEQSKSFEQSQEHVKLISRRWLDLQTAAKQSAIASSLQGIFNGELKHAVREAIVALQSRRGKPYGAAYLIEQISQAQHQTPDFKNVQDDIVVFLKNTGASLLFSPSQSYLVSALYDHLDHPTFDEIWTSFADTLTAQTDLQHLEALNAFMNFKERHKAQDLAKKSSGVQAFVREILRARGSFNGQGSVSADVMDCMTERTKIDVLTDAMESLSASDFAASSLETLEAIDNYDLTILPQFVTTGEGRPLLARVLDLETSSSLDVASKASILHQRLIGGGADSGSQSVSLDLLRTELESDAGSATSIDTILKMARAAMTTSSTDVWEMLTRSCPSWQDDLESMDTSPLSPSLAIMSPLAGDASLINGAGPTSKGSHDRFGLSQPVRLALFAVEILAVGPPPDQIDAVSEAQILSLTLRTALSVDDEMSTANPKARLVLRPNASTAEFVSRAKQVVGNRLSAQNFDSDLFREFNSLCLSSISSMSREAYSHAEVFVEFGSNWTETHGYSKPVLAYFEDQFTSQKQTGTTFRLAALACVLAPQLRASQVLQRHCNEVVSDLTGADTDGDQQKALSQLVLLNALFMESDSLDGVVAKQRLVFLMKHIIHWLADEHTSTAIKYQVCVTLQRVLPLIGEIYGDHFSDILQAIKAYWLSNIARDWSQDPAQVLQINGSLRLFQVLSTLSKLDDPNDDLLDALKDNHNEMMDVLLRLLMSPQGIDESTDVPLAITNRLLARICLRIESIDTSTATELYPLLDARSNAIQETALTLLQRFTEQNQEQISFDAAIEKKTAHLSEELLSFVISAPSVDSVLSASIETAIPEDLQTYLLTWILIFSHFKKASSKVREDYTEDIRSQDLLPPLLDLVYEFLGHTTGHAVDVSRYDVVNYVRNQETNPERHVEWLLAHLYYLSLTYLPALTKSHYLAIGNRLTSSSISKWVAKCYSPLIISGSLASVSSWAESFASDPEYENFFIKTRPRAHEITASYLVDEQTMAIMVRLPDAYPLEGARVEGLSRVAVDQRKWLAWLRNCQGVIQFSNGDVVDGLASWRRNVLGALKGQTECAICYSVISADRQLPSKRCGTCKNGFHSGCLFKWFKTSNASSCPLCRTAFNYG